MSKQHPYVKTLRAMRRSLLGLTVDQALALSWAIDVCEAAQKTLNDNGHLADGENCTLIVLKRAVEGDRS